MHDVNAALVGRRNEKRRGFTLVELLVVIAIIGVLVALLLPAIQAARESARRSQCANNLKQIGVGLHDYASAKNTFPPGVQQFCYKCEGWNWAAFTLDYMEEAGLTAQFVYKQQPTAIPNCRSDMTGPTNTVIPTFICPSTSRMSKYRTQDHRITDFVENGTWDPGEGMACMDYGGVNGPNDAVINPVTNKVYGKNRGVLLNITGIVAPGPLTAKKVSPRRITDGLSHTMIVAESTGRSYNPDKSPKQLTGPWADGNNTFAIKNVINLPEPPLNIGDPTSWTKDEIFSDHPAGSQVLMCDGSVHFLLAEIDLKLLFALATRDGDEIIPGDALQ